MYKYEDLRPTLFTDEGQRRFLAIRDNVHDLLKKSGAIRLDKAIDCVAGDTWEREACVDRLVELGEIREIGQGQCAGQYRIFVRKGE